MVIRFNTRRHRPPLLAKHSTLRKARRTRSLPILGDQTVATYTLPDLPYDYAALEKAISGQILELHHDKHHAAYVKGANDPLEKLAAARDGGDFGSIVGLEKTLAFNLSGHILHSI